MVRDKEQTAEEYLKDKCHITEKGTGIHLFADYVVAKALQLKEQEVNEIWLNNSYGLVIISDIRSEAFKEGRIEGKKEGRIEGKEQALKELWGEIRRYLDMPSKTWDRIREKYDLK